MEKPKRAEDSPIAVTLEAGKRYAWCTCGLSEKQPCKATKNGPFCDGSHK